MSPRGGGGRSEGAAEEELLGDNREGVGLRLGKGLDG